MIYATLYTSTLILYPRGDTVELNVAWKDNGHQNLTQEYFLTFSIIYYLY